MTPEDEVDERIALDVQLDEGHYKLAAAPDSATGERYAVAECPCGQVLVRTRGRRFVILNMDNVRRERDTWQEAGQDGFWLTGSCHSCRQLRTLETARLFEALHVDRQIDPLEWSSRITFEVHSDHQPAEVISHVVCKCGAHLAWISSDLILNARPGAFKNHHDRRQKGNQMGDVWCARCGSILVGFYDESDENGAALFRAIDIAIERTFGRAGAVNQLRHRFCAPRS